jgi:hypothetical protein
MDDTPPWLDGDGLHGYLLGRALAGLGDRRLAAERYAWLVEQPQAGDATFWQGAQRGHACRCLRSAG